MRFNPRPGHATGATQRPLVFGSTNRSFNPRPGHATGATFYRRRWSRNQHCFNPRPGHATGATQGSLGARSPLHRFNPRPGHATGATSHPAFPCIIHNVSIRAPVTRPGRHDNTRNCARHGKFQSAPRSRDRGDSDMRDFPSFFARFQSAPRSRDRGDRELISCPALLVEFQSAPRSRDRGDGGLYFLAAGYGCFNPRPGHATGATTTNPVGRPLTDVSIRAPVTRPGRRKTHQSRNGLLLFQSAPRSRDRGDRQKPTRNQ